MDLDGGIFKFSSDNITSFLLRDNQGNALSPLQQLVQNGNTLSQIYSYKTDFSSKFYKGTLETGIKASYVKADNDFLSQSSITNGQLTDYGSNEFIYQETLLAGYLSTKQTFSKFSLQAGLRAEQTYTSGNSVDLNSLVKRSYLNLKAVNDFTKVTVSTKSNLNNNRNTSFNIGYYDKLFDLINISYSGGISQNSYQFNYNPALIRISQLTSYITLDNRVNLKDWWIGLFFYGQTKVTYGNQINLPFSITNISGGRKILKGKGNLSLQVNDVFFTGGTRSEAQYDNVNYDLKSKYDSRRVRLNFSYNFGNAKIDVRKRSSGSADEQRRNQ